MSATSTKKEIRYLCLMNVSHGWWSNTFGYYLFFFGPTENYMMHLFFFFRNVWENWYKMCRHLTYEKVKNMALVVITHPLLFLDKSLPIRFRNMQTVVCSHRVTYFSNMRCQLITFFKQFPLIPLFISDQ